jgi:hypothetical protein
MFDDLEDKIVFIGSAILMIMFFFHGGIGFLAHPVWLISFIFVFGGIFFYIFTAIFPNGISSAKNYKPENKISSDKKTVMPKPDNKVVIPKNRKPIK